MNAIKGPANSKYDRKLSRKPTIDNIIDKKPSRRNTYPMTVTNGLSMRIKRLFRANVDNNISQDNKNILGWPDKPWRKYLSPFIIVPPN